MASAIPSKIETSRILVLEEATNSLMHAVLAQNGFEVTVCRNEDAAYAATKDKPYSCIIVDCRLTANLTAEVVEQLHQTLRAKSLATPIFIMNEQAAGSSVRQVRAFIADAFSERFDLGAFVARVKQLCPR